MDHNDTLTPTENKKEKNRQIIVLSVLAIALLLVGDLYVMINMSSNYLVIGVITVVLLVCAYVLINAILKEMDRDRQRAGEQHDALVKAEKASYILTKKVIEQFDGMEHVFRDPMEEIISAQKGIAKVTINRNREHAEAMMNSNDRVLEQIIEFEEKFDNIQNEILNNNDQLVLQDAIQKLDMRQQEMLSGMNEMELKIKSEILTIAGAIEDIQAQNASMQLVMEQRLSIEQQPAMEQLMMEEQPAIEEQPVVEEQLAIEEQPVTEEQTLAVEESVIDEGLDLDGLSFDEEIDLNEPSLNDMLDLGESSVNEEIDILASELGEEMSLGESSINEEIDILASELREEIGLGGISLDDGLSIDEAILSEEPDDTESILNEELDLSFGEDLGEEFDLNVDEAALDEELDLDIGEAILDENLDLGEPVLEPEPIPEPTPEPAPKKVSPVEPDISSSNKMMTPEEIAALLANM